MSFRHGLHIYISFFVLYIVLYYLIVIFNIFDAKDYSSFIELIGSILSLPLFIICVNAIKDSKRYPWLLFFISAVLFIIGESFFAYNEIILGVEPETPSLADFFYITDTILLILGFILYLNKNHNINIASISIDTFLSIYAASGIIYAFIINPTIQDSESNISSLIVSLFYPILDIALLFCLLTMLFNTKKQFKVSYFLFGLSFLTMFISDQIAFLEDIYSFDTNHLIDPIWASCFFILALSGIYDIEGERLKKDISEHTVHYFDTTKTIFPYLLTFFILVLIVYIEKRFSVLFIWGITLIILLSIRQIILLNNNKSLMKHIKNNEIRLRKKNLVLRDLNKKIDHDAKTDFLTGLYNRKHINTTINALSPLDQTSMTLGLLLVDVDLFKQINDRYGHQVGDKVLMTVASNIKAVLREDDIPGRYGGDEFIVLLPSADIRAVNAVGNRLINQVREDEYLHSLGVSLSIGGTSATMSKDTYDVDALIRSADRALYEAKNSGRDRCIVEQDSHQEGILMA